MSTTYEIKKSVCSICSRNCGVDVWLKDGKIQKVEPTNGGKGGQLCVKGYANREYVLREDRIKTPLKRVGKRGEGKFKEITWAEAYQEIADKLLEIRASHGADSVAFFTGYSKWYRPVYHRFVHSFGTLNYGTESSSCHQSYRMACDLNTGTLVRPDMMNSDLFIGWAYNPFYNGNYENVSIEEYKEKGGKLLIIDPRVTPVAKYADILLRPIPGTDGALALFFGNYLIKQGAIDQDYITQYVYGFEEYKKYAAGFTLKRTAKITGISEEELLAAAQLLIKSSRFSISISGAAIPHHLNGMQNVRSILSLLAITGNFDREGGNLPIEYSREEDNLPKLLWDEFIDETRPLTSDGSGYQNSVPWQHQNKQFKKSGRREALPKIGSGKFPLWSEIVDEFQAMDLSRQILEETPYPIKAVFSLGLNRRMFPDNEKLMKALEKVDFFVNVDIFYTDAGKYADILLPACSSFERSELIGRGPTVQYVEPAISPLYEAKSDVDIICDLARYMNLEDEVLKQGYDYVCRYVLRYIGVTLKDLKMANGPVRIPGKRSYEVGSNIRQGLRTPTGRFELYSKTIEKFQESHGLSPLPTYQPSLKSAGKKKYPFILTAGGRLPGEFHSRFQKVKATKLIRREAAADIHPEDGAALGICQDDRVIIETAIGQIKVAANLTHMAKKGVVFMYQGYEHSDVNRIIEQFHLDPYSGFPGYRTVRCNVIKEVGE